MKENIVYKVVLGKRVQKSLCKLPRKIIDQFYTLVDDLRLQGPMVPGWHNFSKLGDAKYHCHLTYSWVACWEYEKDTITIEVYYVGSRENAPY
jgi:hypothetical protein